MKKLCYLSLFILYSVCSFAQQQELPVPKPHQLKWHEAEMGAVFHYDLHVFDGIRYGQGNNRINPIEDYNIFNPTELNTDQWVQAAKAAGCKFGSLYPRNRFRTLAKRRQPLLPESREMERRERRHCP